MDKDITWDYFRRVIYRIMMGRDDEAYEKWLLTKKQNVSKDYFTIGATRGNPEISDVENSKFTTIVDSLPK